MNGTAGHHASSHEDVLRDRAVRLFRFLRELAFLKSRIVRDLSDYDKVVWFHDVPKCKGCFSVLGPETERLQDTTWLDIRHPTEPERPTIPLSCARWLEEDAHEEDAHVEPRLRDEIVTEGQTERVSDHPEVQREWERWKQDSGLPWDLAHKDWEAADEIYFKLFSIHQQLKRLGEQYELLIGLGLLSWETPNNQVIRRHIIVGDAHLLFDADRARFELQPASEGTKLHLETDMIEQCYLPSLEQVGEIEASVAAIQESPWDQPEMDKVLRSFINSLSPHGMYSNSSCPPDKPTKQPTLTFAPALILRMRTQRSQVQCLDSIIGKIANGGDIPSGVRTLCEEPERTAGGDEDDESVTGSHKGDDDVYLPLPANEEQKEIIYQIKNQNGILVQGPPGTGKSHTIANIICHLLAEGKRVLVTSQTPRALAVLKKKIPEETRALCVTLLSNDPVARQELEYSVDAINREYAGWDQLRSQRLILELNEHLYRTRKEKADSERLLRELREVNTYQHEVAEGTYQGTAQQIAQRIASEERTFAWLDEDVAGQTPCPMSNVELARLLRLHRELPEDQCSELRKELVSRDLLPDIARFVKMIDDERKAHREMTRLESRRGSLRYRAIQQLPEQDIESIRKAIADVLAARTSLRSGFAWIEQAVSDVLAGNDTPWNNLHDFMIGHLGILDEKIALTQALDMQFTEHVDRARLRADALDLLGHLEAGGRTGWWFLAPAVVRRNRYIADEVKVNGRFCRTPEQLRLLITYLEAFREVDLLWSAFEGKGTREEGALLLQVGHLRKRLEAVYDVLRLKSLVDTAKKCLKASRGLGEPQWHKSEDLEEMILDIEAAESEHAYREVTSALEQAIQDVRIAHSSPKSHDLNHEILAALEERDTQAFAQCLGRLEILESRCAALRERESLDGRLRQAAPRLERQLENGAAENFWDERAAHFEAAWAWKLADSWVREFGREHNEVALEASLGQLTIEERKIVSKVSAAKAWDSCLRKLTAFQRANLVAWATAMRKTPKTLTAKTRPKWLRAAREAMDNCRGAIPAWIMPLYRVFEAISPAPECFDVVIVDEASQTGPEGLVLQYLAKQIIIVGDAQQISPDAIGVPEENIEALTKRYLAEIPFRDYYHPQTSLFAFAEILFSSKTVLREHFRCMPEIIQFSNQLCYAGTPLKPLRQYPPKRLEPILLRHVRDGFREGAANNVLNRPEADAIVESIVAMCSATEYSGKTIGVISLQGEAQAKHIESKLLTRLRPTDMETRRIVCGDAYAFQGDERDIMLLSMVADPNQRIGVLNREADKRRFNVAASRAKDQVILFHTATLNDLHPDCMRHKLLKYYSNPTRQVHEVDLGKCESQFERDVCQAIVDKGYRAIPQYKVAEYRIDMVLEGAKSRLAVECDGDEWHGLDNYERDMARQRILERCGWRFWRIRGHEYYRSPSNALEPLWKLLSDMDIRPPSVSTPESEAVVEDKQREEVASAKGTTVSDQTVVVGASAVKGESKERAVPGSIPTAEYTEKAVETSATPYRSDKAEFGGHRAQFFFKLAHHAKESDKLAPWERSLIFRIGEYLTRGWHISEKMERQAIRIIQTARESGIVEAVEKELQDRQPVSPSFAGEKKAADSLQESFRWFCEEGLPRLLMAKSPIQHTGNGLELHFMSFAFGEPAHTADGCRQAGLTYARPLDVTTHLLIRETGEIKEQEVHLADVPMITTNGTHIIHGLERVLAIRWIENRSLDNSPIDRGLDVMKSTAIRRMRRVSLESVTPSRLIDTGPFQTAISEFFGT